MIINELEIKRGLQNRGIRPSNKRVAVMKYLIENPVHPTVDEIYRDLHKSIPSLSKTTVYNTLKILVGNGAVLSLLIDDKNCRYDGFTHSHAHFICNSCGKIFDVGLKEGYNFNGTVDLKGFNVKSAHLYFSGYCELCNSLAGNCEQ